MLFALDGQHAGTERAGEADANLVRGGRVTCDRYDHGSGQVFDVLGVGVADGGPDGPMLTQVASLDGSAGVG